MSMAHVKNVRQTLLDVAQLLVSQKGYSAVGLNEVLQNAQVPKGSFYHYFGSKDAFGVALLDHYFGSYLQVMSELFAQNELTERQKLNRYWQQWIANQTGDSDAGKCLAVKLGAEVADLSEPMRQALERGTSSIIACIAASLTRGGEDRSLILNDAPQNIALQLYSLWLGASVLAKISRTATPFDQAMSMTQQVLKSTPSIMK